EGPEPRPAEVIALPVLPAARIVFRIRRHARLKRGPSHGVVPCDVLPRKAVACAEIDEQLRELGVLLVGEARRDRADELDAERPAIAVRPPVQDRRACVIGLLIVLDELPRLAVAADE